MVTEVLPAPAGQRRQRTAQTQVLFGSDFPVITPDRWLADFARLDVKDDVRPLVLKDNAARILGLT